MRMHLITRTIVILIMSKIHYVTNTRCGLHEFVSHRDAPEALSRSLVFLTNGSDGPFATKQRLIYAVIKGHPSALRFRPL